MEALHRSNRHHEPSSKHLVAVQYAMHSAGKWDIGVRLHTQWTHAPCRISANLAIEGCARGGAWQTALQIARSMHMQGLPLGHRAAGILLHAYVALERPKAFTDVAQAALNRR
eukprot:PhM_4_TR1335/c1_g1_i1/m.48681